MRKICAALVATALLATAGCNSSCERWQYATAYFQREAFADKKSQVDRLNELGGKGWEYAGPLTNDGINAKWIAFKRCAPR